MDARTDHTLTVQNKSINAPKENIPGQESNEPSPPGYLEGTSVSSGPEKGSKLLDRDEEDLEEGEDGIVMGTDADVTEDDISVLEDADYMPTIDEDNLRQSALDNTDNEGDLLNESGTDMSGRDLDVPGSETDDDTEDLGEEDEENNSYSLGGDDHDQ